MADEDQIRMRLLEIKSMCGDVPYMLFFVGIKVMEKVDLCVEKDLQLGCICDETFHSDIARPQIESVFRNEEHRVV